MERGLIKRLHVSINALILGMFWALMRILRKVFHLSGTVDSSTTMECRDLVQQEFQPTMLEGKSLVALMNKLCFQ